MAELLLPQDQRLALRAQAHRLDPVVLLGAGGLSAAALREINRALDAHGLVKIRAGRADRQTCAALYLEIAERLGAARIQSVGHTLVLYRPRAEPPAASRAGPGKAPRQGLGGKPRRARAGQM